MKRTILYFLLHFALLHSSWGAEVAQEITVEHPAGNGLVSAASAIDFGWISVGTTSSQKSFRVVNTGGMSLSGLSVTISGPSASSFVITGISLPTSLGPGAAGGFNVSYTAHSQGAVEATLQITSNDQDENPFNIALLGKGALPGLDDPIDCGAFNMEFVPIGSPGNTHDDTSYGAVDYAYRIAKHEVSRLMIDAYNARSGGPQITMASITSNGNSIVNFPATGVSWNHAARFINWLNTSSGYSPAYKFTTAGANDNAEPWTPADGLAYDPDNPFRNPQAYYFLPNENEWYKAAYFDPAANSGLGGYWDYARGSNLAPQPVSGGLSSAMAVYNGQTGPANVTNAGGLSTLGTMAQNGNADEWCETLLNPPYDTPGEARVIRGGGWTSSATMLMSSNRRGANTTALLSSQTFRVASRPSPEKPAGLPEVTASYVLDDYRDSSNLLADRYTFKKLHNNPIELWEIKNGKLHVYTGSQKSAGYIWNDGKKLAAVGDAVSLHLYENTDGAVGLQFIDDLTTPIATGAVRYYKNYRVNTDTYERNFLGPWGNAMPLSGAPLGEMLLTVKVLRVDDSCMHLNAKLSGEGFDTIDREFSIPSTQLYFGIHSYCIYDNMSTTCDNLVFSKLAPEIAVEHPLQTNLLDGAALLAFGTKEIGVATEKTITVKNTGSANLTGLAVTHTGTNASDFVLSAPGATTLPPGASTTFKVTYTPSAPGTSSVALQISSNDRDENPFDIYLEGTGAPLGPEIAVEHPVGSDLVDGAATMNFGSSNVGDSVIKTITMKNTGGSNLTGLALSLSGANYLNFSLQALGTTTLSPGASTTFTVTFSPSAAGTRIATLQISSNDADENPFNITLSGIGVVPPAPEIVVQHPLGTNLVDGTTPLAFGNVQIGKTLRKTVTVRNAGKGNLTGLVLTRTGTNATEFGLGDLGALTLAPGESTSFTVAFTPTATGSRSAALKIASNDADENPFNISLVGMGLVPPAPEIVVEQPLGTSLVDGTATLMFGKVPIGTMLRKTVTIKNTGTANLTNLAVTHSGTNVLNFVLGGLGATTLAPGASTNFTVTFTPSATGERVALLQIASNDANERPFDIKLNGVGTKPEITVIQGIGPDRILRDNLSIRDFGIVKVGQDSKVMTFSIKNDGTAPLKQIKITNRGKNPGDFRVIQSPGSIVAPGATTQFKVVFSPSAAASRSAVLYIANNDANENPFQVLLKGQGEE